MFGMGFGEMLVVLMIAVIFLGPEKIPQTARTLGKWFHELKSYVDEIKQSFETDLRDTNSSQNKNSSSPALPKGSTEQKKS